MNKSLLIAVVIAVIAVLWVLSGVVGTSNDDVNPLSQPSDSTLDNSQSDIPEVRVQQLSSQQMNDNIEVTGRTQASRQVNVSAETDGQVASILISKGDIVEKGQILAKLEIRDRVARVNEAKQLLNQRQIQYKAAKELTEKGFNSRVRMAEAQAQLESAKAQLKMTRVELSNINIKAPFSGVINDQMIELGDYVSKGSELFDVVDLNPIEIVGFVTEKQMKHVSKGDQVIAEFLYGHKISGEVTFIAAVADPQTRTFKVEITLDNKDHEIREGLTVKLKIPVHEAGAYKISPSILSLSDDGIVGIKVVNSDNKVEFMPIRLVKDTPKYLWIGGLPDSIKIITVGQEFVVPGQVVKPIQSDGASLL